MATLHLRCGSDIRKTLSVGGFGGGFLEYSDPVCQGPVPEAGDLLSLRARFLNESYDVALDAVTAKLAAEADGLESAACDYARVVLWFEHDTYDQLILARVLAHFAERQTPAVLEMVTTDRYPGIDRFLGLGQLPPEALRALWETRTPVTDVQLDLGRRVWAALRAPEPGALQVLVQDGCAALPYMAGAVRRHLMELPGMVDGLSLTERLILEILRDGARTAGQVFHELMMVREPLPWLGDTMFLHILRSMMHADKPVFDVESGESGWAHWALAINDTGLDVLAGRCDFLSLMPPERWLGGIPIRAGEPCWRWDAVASQPVSG